MTSTDTRRTRQRGLIRTCLGDTQQFQTAQQIYDQLRAAATPVSLPTIYRTVVAMAQAGELDVRTADGVTAYRRCTPDHHHHLVCRACGRTIELTKTPVETWIADVAKQYGFADIDHITEISGVCPNCQEGDVR